MRLKCPACNAEMDLDVLLAHEEGRHVLAQLVALSLPLGRLLLAYVGLFRPGKRSLSMSRTLAILAEVIADMQRGHITRKGRDWPASQAQWQAAIEQVLAARDKGTLTPPLTGHGYLYEVLLGLVDKAESVAEKEREASGRSRAHSGGPAAIEQVLNAQPGVDFVKRDSTPENVRAAAPAPAGPSPYARKLQAEIKAKLAARNGSMSEEGNPDEQA